jgi:hypothetical protein
MISIVVLRRRFYLPAGIRCLITCHKPGELCSR